MLIIDKVYCIYEISIYFGKIIHIRPANQQGNIQTNTHTQYCRCLFSLCSLWMYFEHYGFWWDSWGDGVKAAHCVTAGQYMLDRSRLHSVSQRSASVSHTTKITKRGTKSFFFPHVVFSSIRSPGVFTVATINKPLPQISFGVKHTLWPHCRLGALFFPQYKQWHQEFISCSCPSKIRSASGPADVHTHTRTCMLIYARLRDTMMVINFSPWIIKSRAREPAQVCRNVLEEQRLLRSPLEWINYSSVKKWPSRLSSLTVESITEGVTSAQTRGEVCRETGKTVKQDSFGVTMAWYPAGIVGIWQLWWIVVEAECTVMTRSDTLHNVSILTTHKMGLFSIVNGISLVKLVCCLVNPNNV